MPGLQAAYVIAIRRIFFNWRLELVLLLGIVLAVSLMSSGVVFSDLLAEAALRRSLDQSTPQEANVTIRVYNDLDDPVTVPRERSTYQAGIDFVDRKVADCRFDQLEIGVGPSCSKTDPNFLRLLPSSSKVTHS